VRCHPTPGTPVVVPDWLPFLLDHTIQDAAVAARRHSELDTQLEVLEALLGDDVAAEASIGLVARYGHQHPVPHFPSSGREHVLVVTSPSVGRLTVEQQPPPLSLLGRRQRVRWSRILRPVLPAASISQCGQRE